VRLVVADEGRGEGAETTVVVRASLAATAQEVEELDEVAW
jgi:hypothetical protein